MTKSFQKARTMMQRFDRAMHTMRLTAAVGTAGMM